MMFRFQQGLFATGTATDAPLDLRVPTPSRVGNIAKSCVFKFIIGKAIAVGFAMNRRGYRLVAYLVDAVRFGAATGRLTESSDVAFLVRSDS